MTRREANRILDAVRYGNARPSENLITRALAVTGDLGACHDTPVRRAPVSLTDWLAAQKLERAEGWVESPREEIAA